MNAKDYLTSAKLHSRCRAVFLCSSSLPCFCPFLKANLLNWNEVLPWLFPEFVFFFCGFLNHLPNRRRRHLLCWRWALLAGGGNAFCHSDEHFSAGNEHVENASSNFTHTHTACYHWLSNRTYLKMIATHTGNHVRKRALAIMLSYTLRVRFSNNLKLYTQ